MFADRVMTQIKQADPVVRYGRIIKVMPTMLEADGPNVSIGALCRMETGDGAFLFAEVVGIERGVIRLVPYGPVSSISAGSRITAHGADDQVMVGDMFLGRAINALGQPLDNGVAIVSNKRTSLPYMQTEPLARQTRKTQLETGVKAIDGLLPLGVGQRVGIFAASGVGKTSLVQQLARQVNADRCVICLIGERGREVEALWSDGMSTDLKQRSTLLAATSDESAVMRIRAVHYALALARQWRAEGHHVVFFLDSISRYAMALRETGLAAGEPPTVRGYTPNVFAALPKLVEQCGALKSGGAISAFFTVLSESDDNDDPICEVMKSLLDGHIILSRDMADRGHFPAIDVERSISRLASVVTDKAQAQLMQKARQLLSTYTESKLLIDSGLYVKGSNPLIDEAITHRLPVERFLQQPASEASFRADTQRALMACLGGAH